jgi:type II secretory pathway component PulF
LLEKKGMLVEFVGEETVPRASPAGASVEPSQEPLSFASTVSGKYEPEALNNLYRQVAAMLRAGVPLVTAITSISGGAYSPRIRSTLDEIRTAVDRGDPISSVIERRKDVFPTLHASVIRAAERGGFMDSALTQLSEYLAREIEVRNEWKRRTFYPKVVLIVALGIIIITNIIITVIADKTGGPRFYLTNILLNPWVGGPLIILAIVAFVFLRSARSVRRAARLRDEISFWIPYYASTAQMYAIAKFSRALALLFGAGVPIREAVQLAGDASGNLVIADQVRPLAQKLNDGGSVWDALRESDIFTPTALDMIRAGEISGSLQQLLEHLALHYEEEGKVRMTKFTTTLTTAVYILILLTVATTILGFWMSYGAFFSPQTE